MVRNRSFYYSNLTWVPKAPGVAAAPKAGGAAVAGVGVGPSAVPAVAPRVKPGVKPGEGVDGWGLPKPKLNSNAGVVAEGWWYGEAPAFSRSSTMSVRFCCFA